MAKGKGEVAGWITRNGVHVPIYGNYTVRGGEEPKAKGSKFKGASKKRKKPDLNAIKGYASDPRTATGDPTVIKVGNEEYFKSGENRWEKHSASGRVLSSSISDEKMNDIVQKHDGDITVLEGKQAKNSATEGESDASKGKQVEGKGAVKDVEGKKPVTKEQEKKESSKVDRKQDAIDYIAKREDVHPSVAKDTYEHMSESERNHVANEAFKRKQAEKSSTPDFSKMSYGEAGKYVSEHKKDFGLKPEDDAYQAAYEMKQGTWKGQMSGQESSMKDSYSQETFGKNYSELNNDERQHVDEWAPKEKSTNTSKNTVSTTESYPWTKSFGSSEPSASEYGKALESINKRYDSENRTVPGKEMGKVFEDLKPGDKIQIHKRGAVYPNTYTVNDDGTIDYSTPSSAFLGKEGMSLAEAQKHATNDVDNRITIMRRKSEESSKPAATPTSAKESGSAKEAKGSIPTTVSGLRSAYAEATGSEKAAIASELRRKGYSLIGGKWIKGR